MHGVRQSGLRAIVNVSEEARQDQARLNTERIIGTGGSLKLSKSEEAKNPHRAVVGGGVQIQTTKKDTEE